MPAKYKHEGVEFKARYGIWHKVPNAHGLIYVKVIVRGKEQRWGVVLWHAFGYWEARYRMRVDRMRSARIYLREKFHSEDEAKRYLDTVLVISPEKP